jgi:hypothetical protein
MEHLDTYDTSITVNFLSKNVYVHLALLNVNKMERRRTGVKEGSCLVRHIDKSGARRKRAGLLAFAQRTRCL